MAPLPLKVHRPQAPLFDAGSTAELPSSPTVLLLVDFINPLQFPLASRLAPAARAAAKATAMLKNRLTRDGVLTIYANDNYGQWTSDFASTLSYCLSRGGVAAEMATTLKPNRGDLVILKPRHSAFFATPLELVLAQTHAKRLIIAGLATDICVQLTAMDASLRGYALWVPRDCNAAERADEKAQALVYMHRVLKADIRASTTKRKLA